MIIANQEKPSIAVVCFENRSGDRELDYLGDAFLELLSVDLSQSKYLHVLRSDQVYEIYKKLKLPKNHYCSEKELRNIAETGRVKHILIGSYMKVGKKLKLTSKLINSISGRTLYSQLWEVSDKQEIFPRVDEITRGVKLSLKILPEQLRDDLDDDISKVTTNSAKALKYYVEGREYFKLFQFDKSIEAMKKAILEDSNFAMAYRAIAFAYKNTGVTDKDIYNKFLQKAFKLKEHVTNREHLIIKGDYNSVDSENWGIALESYKTLFDLYPEDVYVIKLVGLLNELERYEEALRICKVYYQLYPNIYAYSNMGLIYSGKGDYKKAIEFMEEGLSRLPENRSYLTARLAILYMSLGQYEKSFEYIEKVKNPNHLEELKGNVLWLVGDYQGARSEYERLINSLKDSFKILNIYKNLGYLNLAYGRFEESINDFQKGLELSVKWNNSMMISQFNQDIAISYLKSGNSKKALRIINETIQPIRNKDLVLEHFFLHDKGMILIENGFINEGNLIIDKMKSFKKDWMSDTFNRFSFHLKGLIEMKEKNYIKAINFFNIAVSLVPGQDYLSLSDWYKAEFIEHLAKAYYLSGDLKKALKKYEKITKLTSARLIYGDVYPKAYYMLGKIYDTLGNRKKSINSYKKFISLWKDCDQQFQYMIEDAMIRIEKQKIIAL